MAKLFKLGVIGIIVLQLFSNEVFAYKLVGKVLNEENNSPVPYASLYLALQEEGTVADSLGRFSIKITLNKMDTLLVGSLGFRLKKVPLSSNSQKKNIVILLTPRKILLRQAKIAPQGALDYIRKHNLWAIQNYPTKPSKGLIINQTKLYENGKLALKQHFFIREVLFHNPPRRAYPYMQLLDYQLDNQGYKMQFMKKHKSKAKKHLKKYDFVSNTDSNLVGMASREKLMNKMHRFILFGRFRTSFLDYYGHFLDADKFRKYKYKLLKTCDKGNEILIDCDAKSFKYGISPKVKVTLECGSYAIKKVTYTLDFRVPLALKALFLATGYHIKSLKASKRITLKKTQNKWFYSEERVNMSFYAKKKSFFITQYKSKFDVSSKTKYFVIEPNTKYKINIAKRFDMNNANFSSQIKKEIDNSLSKFILEHSEINQFLK